MKFDNGFKYIYLWISFEVWFKSSLWIIEYDCDIPSTFGQIYVDEIYLALCFAGKYFNLIW